MTFRPTGLLYGVVLLSMASSADAAIIPWTDNTPSALAPFAGQANSLASLAGSDLVFYGHPAQSLSLTTAKGLRHYKHMRFQSAALVVPASPDEVKATLSNYSRYVGLFPTLTQAKVIDQQGGIQQVRYHISVPVPIPLLSFNEDVVMQHQLSGNSLSTLILDSPIPYGAGKFEWFALANGQTLVTLTQWGDLDQPKGFLVSTLLRAMPEVKLGIPQGVNGFVLESLRRRFAPDASNQPALSVQNIVPTLRLTDAQLDTVQRLVDQSTTPVLFAHRPVWLATHKRPEKLHFVTSIGTLNAPLAQAKPLLANPSNYATLMRQVKRVDTTDLPNGQGQRASIHVGIGLGVIDIPFRLHMRYQPQGDQSVRFWANGGDIEFMQGRMQFDALSPQKTRIIMTSAGKIGDHAPLLLRMSKAMPYSDFLPSLGAAPVLLDKANRYLQKKP